MFKITKLILFDKNKKKFIYNFSEGINYFQGKNSSGKTEFYLFIDFMFGSSEDIMRKPWYKDSLEKATMTFEYNDNTFVITRTRNTNHNYLHYADQQDLQPIDLREYKNKLNSIFAQDIQLLKDIRNFTNEELTYRTFTMFNFLGEKRQGEIQDFLDKCSEVKYSVKLNSILNFIFNKNLEEIYKLQNELDVLQQEVKELERHSQKYDFIIDQVNANLQKVGCNILYTGENQDEIKAFLFSVGNMGNDKKVINKRNIADLEVMFNNISEQIKVYENNIADAKQFEKGNENRRKLLIKLHELVDENAEFDYLAKPMQNLLDEVDNTIFFSNYLINDNTIKELKKQRETIKIEIHRNDPRFKIYNLEQKSKDIALIEEFLSIEISSNFEIISEKKNRIKDIRKALKVLQNADDLQKVEHLSNFITKLYYSAKEKSSVVSNDIKKSGFEIKYLKKGNILQPMILSDESESSSSKKRVNYYIGSMARHTIIQLCGYLAFLKILLENNRYPIIPILVIDHISKPFDQKNSSAIGKILSTAYEAIGKKNLQIFIFDNEDFENLDISPDNSVNLLTDSKSGFNPFYFSTM